MEITRIGVWYFKQVNANNMERSKVVINIARINRINKKLNYLLECKDDFYTSALDQEFSSIGLWALEILTFWRECKDPVLTEQIINIGSSANFYKLLLSAKMPDDVTGAISMYIDTMAELRAEIKQELELSKGAYSMLPKELANELAVELLNRGKEAGFLNGEYQPSETTTNSQLKLIAYAIGKSLNLKPIWSPFEQLWKKTHLPAAIIPANQLDKIGKIDNIMRLYQEVDFSPIINYGKYRNFKTKLTTGELTKIFASLQKKNYIDTVTTIDQWLSICGKGDLSENIDPINWKKTGRELIYFIDKLLGNENSDCYIKITVNCFLINGKRPNDGSMRSGLTNVKSKEYNGSYFYPDIMNVIKG